MTKRWRRPAYDGEYPTLGWQVLEWTEKYLPSPSDDRRPFQFTPDQAERILRWFRLHPVTGEFVYETLVLEEAKGSGKSPVAAVLELVEFVGPCLFDGWNADGEPVAVEWGIGDRPLPTQQIAAVSEDQTDNTYGAMYGLLIANDAQAARDLRIDLGRTRLYRIDDPVASLEPVTASAGSREGQRLTHATLDETHLWTRANGGTKLAGVLRRNVAKMGGRIVETTNAPVLGERSVAEGRNPDAPSAGVLHYARRPRVSPDPEMTDGEMVELLEDVYGDAYWVDKARLIREIRRPETPWAESCQFWFNIRTPGANRAVDPRRWTDLAAPVEVPAGADVGLGFEGTDRAVVLRACTRDGYGFTVGEWTASRGDLSWMPPRAAVADAVASAFESFHVGRFLVNPAGWRTEAESWAQTFGDDVVLGIERNQPTRMSRAVDRWMTALRRHAHPHDGDPVVAEHVSNAYLRKVRTTDDDADSRTMYVLERGGASLPISGAVADVLALEAAETMAERTTVAVAVAWT